MAEQTALTERQYLDAIERRDRRIRALEEATTALARTMLGKAVLPDGRAVPAEEMLSYLRQKVEADYANGF